LPEDIEWPRGISYERNVPLHFLAQIECADLPRIDNRLPEQGALFFFASQDEEQIWNEGDPQARIRVIYSTNAAQAPLRSAPDDLPPISDHTADKPYGPV
jgi:uncharacterized protein YwqG